MHPDYQPIIVAFAALIVAVTPAVVGLLVGLRTHERVRTIERSTNGSLEALQAEVVALRAEVAGRRAGDVRVGQ